MVSVPPKIVISGLTKQFQAAGDAVQALDGCDIEIAEGEFVTIVGPSGCGKTTLLRIVAGLETPTQGSVTVRRRDAGKPLSTMVFQETSIFPWMTVRANVGYGLMLRDVPRVQLDPVVDKFLALTGLERFAQAYPHQLSGGMKQRASVARAFANDPEVLLMDEPFAALDEQNKILLQEELLRNAQDCAVHHALHRRSAGAERPRAGDECTARQDQGRPAREFPAAAGGVRPQE